MRSPKRTITLIAFLDHGKVCLSLEEGIVQTRQVLAELERLGISMKDVTRELEDERVESFSDAFTILLKAIEARTQGVVPD